MKKRAFDTWEYEEIELTFGTERVKKHPLLLSWEKAQYTIPEPYQTLLYHYQELLIDNADAWNEDELKFFFISPLIGLVSYETPHYKPFTQRNLSASFPEFDLEISGRVEFMLAKGKQHPRQPFFFLHEYKQERRRDNDPLGQLLISMLAAQQRNQADFPLYGSFVTGRLWFFVILEGTQYDVSLAYDATQTNELHQIFAMLQKIKELIAIQHAVA